jgi:hypothetical protein
MTRPLPLLVLFLVLGLLWISRPGLYYDEVLWIQAAWPRDDVPIAYMMHFRGRPVALMIISYLGALKGWLYWPLLCLFGPSPLLVRLPMLLLGAAALWFFYLFARRAFGPPAALAALALTATDPIYLFTTRLDWGPVVIQRLLLALGCWAVLCWCHHRRRRDLFWGCFAFGLAVFDKATFLWVLAALAAATLLVFPARSWRALRFRALPIALAGLFLGAAPFLYYCRKWPGETFRQQRELPEKYAEKLRAVQYTLQGVVLIGWLARDPGPDPPETLLLPACVAALLLLPALPFQPWGRGMLFLAAFLLAAFLQMLPIRNAGAVHHLALLLPFPHLFVAAALTGARDRLQTWLPRAGSAALVLLVALLAAANLRSVAHHYYRLLASGGGPGWSEAIYRLHTYLETASARTVVLLDWGMMNQLRLLSRDRLPLLEATEPRPEWLDSPGILFVRPAPGEPPAFPHIAAAFRRAWAERGLEPRVIETIRDDHRRPIYEVLVPTPAPPR